MVRKAKELIRESRKCGNALYDWAGAQEDDDKDLDTEPAYLIAERLKDLLFALERTKGKEPALASCAVASLQNVAIMIYTSQIKPKQARSLIYNQTDLLVMLES